MNNLVIIGKLTLNVLTEGADIQAESPIDAALMPTTSSDTADSESKGEENM